MANANYSRPQPGTHCHHSLCPSCTEEDAPEPGSVVSLWYWTCCRCRFRNLALTFHQREVSGTICCNPAPPAAEPLNILEPIMRAVAGHPFAMLNRMSPQSKAARTRARRQTYPPSTSSHGGDLQTAAEIPLIRVQPPGTYLLQGQSQGQRGSEKAVVLTGQSSASMQRRSFSTLRGTGNFSGGCAHQCSLCLPRDTPDEEWYFCCRCCHLHPAPRAAARSPL